MASNHSTLEVSGNTEPEPVAMSTSRSVEVEEGSDAPDEAEGPASTGSVAAQNIPPAMRHAPGGSRISTGDSLGKPPGTSTAPAGPASTTTSAVTGVEEPAFGSAPTHAVPTASSPEQHAATRPQPAPGANATTPSSVQPGIISQQPVERRSSFSTDSSKAGVGGPPVSNFVSLTSWTIDQFKHTKQVVMEKLGKADRSHDPELEARIERLETVRNQYMDMTRTCEVLLKDIVSASRNQALLSTQFAAFGESQPELAAEFESSARTMQTIASHADPLITAMKFFVSNLATLCDKTMADTMDSVAAFNASRVDYDVSRLEHGGSETDIDVLARKARYDKARETVIIKMDLLDENRVKVLKKQLLIFNNAMVAYFSGNEEAMEDAIAQIGTGYDHVPETPR